jgi:hypothetical protein
VIAISRASTLGSFTCEAPYQMGFRSKRLTAGKNRNPELGADVTAMHRGLAVREFVTQTGQSRDQVLTGTM